MYLNKNIKAQNKNAFYHLVIGLIFFGMVVWVASKGNQSDKGITQFDWVYIIVFGLAGLKFTVQGLLAIFSKAYMRVDDERIAVKTDESSKSETIYWRDIQQIKQKENKFEIIRKDKPPYIIHLSYMNYENAGELKESIRQMACKKGISIIIEETAGKSA